MIFHSSFFLLSLLINLVRSTLHIFSNSGRNLGGDPLIEWVPSCTQGGTLIYQSLEILSFPLPVDVPNGNEIEGR